MTIDMNQFKTAVKDAIGGGRPATDYDRLYRAGLRDAEMFVVRLSKGWRYENREWIEPK